MDDDVRQLVCEGGCNPLLHEYDSLVVQLGAGNPGLLPYVAERARELTHTPHMLHRGYSWWNGGWVKSFRCMLCGYIKRF